ncbi:MAG: lipid-A-disaccharide synthase [Candidatus Cloacimonetes bacterium]|jgi:lipid-A-disaccharide synthase|nr:lipid-A-disaccharide synthase [Candidatus Cloacimonadota bacterium]MDD4157132.1 lipid-A-disaccharide synthase [Candidatus Cloacimonadota bacterium]
MTIHKNTEFTIFWLAGEKSGDTHASEVMKKLNNSSTTFNHIGIGGPLMVKQGLKTIFPFEKFNVMGFVEILKHLSFFSSVEKRIKNILNGLDTQFPQKPDLVILVDYPGLNLRIAKLAYNTNIKVLYYICPQFWAWKHHRVNILASYCDLVLVILPFEKDLLEIHRINTEYVGHPVMEEIKFKLTKEEFAQHHQLDTQKKWISFFPGSRENEIIKLLPVYIKTIIKLSMKYPDYQFLISKADSVSNKVFMQYLKTDNNTNKTLDDIKLINGDSYEQMKYSDFMIVKSGTTTIEASIIGTPFAIAYIANQISYWIAKKIIKIKFIGLPNIILNEEKQLSEPVIPELIQENVNPDMLISTIEYYMNNKNAYENFKTEINKISLILGKESASHNAKEAILNLL